MIRLAKKILAIVVLLVGAIIGIWLGVENDQPLTLQLFGLALPSFPAGFVIVVTLLLGAAAGVLVSWLPFLVLKNHNRLLQRKLTRQLRDNEHLKSQAQKSIAKRRSH